MRQHEVPVHRRADMKRPTSSAGLFRQNKAVRSVPGAGVLVRLLPVLILLVAHIARLGLGLLGAVLLVLPALVFRLLRLALVVGGLALVLIFVLTIHLVAHVVLRRVSRNGAHSSAHNVKTWA